MSSLDRSLDNLLREVIGTDITTNGKRIAPCLLNLVNYCLGLFRIQASRLSRDSDDPQAHTHSA